jgi:hypothetical protein
LHDGLCSRLIINIRAFHEPNAFEVEIAIEKLKRYKYNNNNNNSIDNCYLQFGYHPVAVVILHLHKYGKKVTGKLKSGGLHERHVVATWNLGIHLSIRF